MTRFGQMSTPNLVDAFYADISSSGDVEGQMRLSGRRGGVFRGYPPTGKSARWLGAALFRFEGARIAQPWVLGDPGGLDAVLVANRAM